MNHTTVHLTSDMPVKLIDSMASDVSVTRSAQVSVKGENNPDTDTPRLINYLMSARHGSPFEHATFTFYVKAPIFVFREFQRHRIASYNERSGRYSKMLPEFYIPSPDRKLVNTGGSAKPEFKEGTSEQYEMLLEGEREVAQTAWNIYEERIAAGIGNELARTVLPLSLFSEMYVTMNARALMNFLSLRVDSPDSLVRSRPQWEINKVADEIEKHFAQLMPHTHEAFVANGRVAP